MHSSSTRQGVWRHLAIAAALVAMAFTASGCVLTPEFFACLASGSFSAEACANDAIAPGPPSAPSGVTATADVVLRQINVDWAPNDEPDVTEYDVYRSTVRGGPYEHAATHVVARHSDTGVSGCVTYYYVVTATDETNQESPFSREVAASLCAPDPVRVPPPTGLAATAGNRSVQLDWDETDPPAAAYNVYRSEEATGPFAKVNSEPVAVSQYAVTDLVGGIEYFFRITAVDAAGIESDPSAIVSATPAGADEPPAAPTGLTATRGDRSVGLDWDDSGTADLAGYNVYRSEEATGSFAKVNGDLVAASEHVVGDLVNGTAYFFRVTAVDDDGDESDASAVVSATPRDEKPAAPKGLTATHSGEDVWLDWDDNREADLARYNVYEARNAAGPFGPLDSVKQSEYLVVETPNIEFFYYVTAVDEAGQESEPSAIVHAKPPSAGPTALMLRGATGPAPDHGWIPFELTISGGYREGGRSRVEGGRLAGTGFVYEGAFELNEASRPPAAGAWRSTTDWVLEPGAGKGSATGIALATFADPEAGEACLRFEQTYRVKRSSKGVDVVTRGTFVLLGGTGEAAKQLGKGSYAVSTRPDGRLTYEGMARPVQGAVPASPPECDALRAVPEQVRLRGTSDLEESSRRPLPPGRLWYRVTLIVGESSKLIDDELTGRSGSLWSVESKAAVILANFCTHRRTGRLLSHEPCARAFRDQPRPAGAVDDLSFGAAVRGEWDTYFNEIKGSPTVHPRPGNGGVGRCTGSTLTLELTEPVRFEGYLGSDSLVRQGLGLTLGRVVSAGEHLTDYTGYTCTWTNADGTPDYESVEPAKRGRSPVMATPPFGDEVKRIRISRVGNRFGRVVEVKRSFRIGSVGEPGTREITLRLNPCPRGGRDVEHC